MKNHLSSPFLCLTPPDKEDQGVCPRCKRGETLCSKTSRSRVCIHCGFSEAFSTYEEALLGWIDTEPPPDGPKITPITKFFETIETGITKIIIPTEFREGFNQHLTDLGILLIRPFKTEVWNNIESAYTEFETSISISQAQLIFEEWERRHFEK